MKLMDKVLNSVSDIWSLYNEHPFVKGIEDGTLDKEKFKYYIIQDYTYLEDYAKVFGIGIAKAKTLNTMKIFSSYADALLNNEMDIHHGYMAKLNLNDEMIKNTSRALDNLSYTSYMLRVAYEEEEAEILASVLSCAYSYEIIAKNIVRNNPCSVNDSFYGDWIKGYSSESYSKENDALIDMLENLTKEYTEKQIGHIIDIFVVCSRYELAFWDLAWNMSV